MDKKTIAEVCQFMAVALVLMCSLTALVLFAAGIASIAMPGLLERSSFSYLFMGLVLGAIAGVGNWAMYEDLKDKD